VCLAAVGELENMLFNFDWRKVENCMMHPFA